MPRETWSGTYEGLDGWEKLIVDAAYEVGFEQGQRSARKEQGHPFSDSDVERFAEVIRRKRVAPDAPAAERSAEVRG